MMKTLGWGALALSVALPLAILAETDICGNEVKSYTEGGVTKTYKFISAGDPRIDVGAAAVSAASHARSSTSDEAGVALASSTRSLVSAPQELEGRYFSELFSDGTSLQSDKFPALMIIFK